MIKTLIKSLRQTSFIAITGLLLITLTGCLNNTETDTTDTPETDTTIESPSINGVYQTLSQEKAKELIGQEDVVLLDVRTEAEFKEGFIPGAILFPLDTIPKNIEAAYPNKAMTYLIYCRSGNRSKQAAEAMIELGYTAVYDIGGINVWPYDIEK